jgi:aspartate kinase
MRVIVQKFGGKCVEPGGNELVAAERIMETRDRGDYPVVVVSAMGRELRDWGEELQALVGQPEGARKLALAHFYSTAELVHLVKAIDPHIEPRELDMLMSCGEIISTVRLAHLLKANGYPTRALSGGQVGLITDGFFGHARVIQTDIRQLVACLDATTIPLVAGFQGISPTDHAITTLGEGGSDYTAVCLAYALRHAPRTPLQMSLELGAVEIFKEVDGVMTANPANFPDRIGPRTLETLTYDELCALAQFGADVIQTEAARMARRYALPVRVCNFRAPEAPGTHVGPETPIVARVAGVADLPSMIVLVIADPSERLLGRITEALAQARLTFLAIPVRDGSWRVALKKEKYRSVTATVEAHLQPRGITPHFEEGHWALVTLVGEGLRARGEQVAAAVQAMLQEAGIHVEGELREEVSVSVLVPEPHRQATVILLHDAFVTQVPDALV